MAPTILHHSPVQIQYFGIVRKIPATVSINQQRDLAMDAINLLLRRNEDWPLKTETENWIHCLYQNSSQTAQDMPDRTTLRLAQECIMILQSAERRRENRQTVLSLRPHLPSKPLTTP